jgi:hypothetical protein
MYKGALVGEGVDGKSIDISKEKSAINDFLNSETAFAYCSWVDEKDSIAVAQGRKKEEWRIFFLYLAEMANSNDAISAAQIAAKVELLFDNFTENDASRIAEFNSDLNKAIAENSKNREGNIIVKVLVDGAIEYEKANSPEIVLNKLKYLKSIGIDDPNINLSIAIEEMNNAEAKAALEAGADKSMSDSALLRKYADKLQDYSN